MLARIVRQCHNRRPDCLDRMPDLLRPKQLAEYLQLSQRSVCRLLERGDIPGVKVGGQWRFRKTAVDEWLDLSIQCLGRLFVGAP